MKIKKNTPKVDCILQCTENQVCNANFKDNNSFNQIQKNKL